MQSSPITAADALSAIRSGVNVVMGTSGLSEADFAELQMAAEEAGVGIVASGNFSLTAAMLQASALLAARFLPTRELAEKLGAIDPAPLAVPIAETLGHPEARGADIGGTRVHSVRLPGFVISAEVIFGRPDER